jgi:hypothetical protein
MLGREPRPDFATVLRDALDEPVLLLSAGALERSLDEPSEPFQTFQVSQTFQPKPQ